jgi:hypothetical protein
MIFFNLLTFRAKRKKERKACEISEHLNSWENTTKICSGRTGSQTVD